MQAWSKHFKIFFGRLRPSSVIFGKGWEMFGGARLAFGTTLENFWKNKGVGNLGNIVKNLFMSMFI